MKWTMGSLERVVQQVFTLCVIVVGNWCGSMELKCGLEVGSVRYFESFGLLSACS